MTSHASGTPADGHERPRTDGYAPQAPQGPQAPEGPKATSSLAKSSAIMASGTLISRILGFVKSMLLAIAIGVTVDAADAFDVANKVPNTLYMLIGGGILNAVLVPQIVRATKRPDGGKDFVNRLLTLSIGVLTVFTAIATVGAPLLVRLYSSGWSAEQTALATAFAFWCLPQVLFYGLYTLLGQVLNAKESFGPYMWAPVLNNVVAIAGLLAFIMLFGPNGDGRHSVGTWTTPQITLLAASATLGVVAQALILLIPLHRIGFSFRPTFGFRGVGLGTAGKVAGWTFGAMLVSQLGFVVTSRVASTATSGGGEAIASNAAYTYSYLIFMLPHSIVAVSLVTALFTTLSKSASNDDADAVRASFAQGMRMVGLVNVFFTAAIIALAAPVAMLVSPGSLDQANAIGNVIMMMILGLVPFSANYLVQRVFYAYEDAKTPFWIQTVQMIVTAVGVLFSGTLLHKEFIVAGIGLSMTAGYSVACVLSLVLLHRKLGNIGFTSIFGAHVKFAVAGVVACLVGFLSYRTIGPSRALSGWIPAFLTAAVIGVLMLVVYLIMCITLRVGELRSLLGVLRRKLGRGGPAPAAPPQSGSNPDGEAAAGSAGPSGPAAPGGAGAPGPAGTPGSAGGGGGAGRYPGSTAGPGASRNTASDYGSTTDDPLHRIREGYDVPTQAFDVLSDRPLPPPPTAPIVVPADTYTFTDNRRSARHARPAPPPRPAPPERPVPQNQTEPNPPSAPEGPAIPAPPARPVPPARPPAPPSPPAPPAPRVRPAERYPAPPDYLAREAQPSADAGRTEDSSRHDLAGQDPPAGAERRGDDPETRPRRRPKH